MLGPLKVVEDDRSLDLGGPKQRAALALLVATAATGIDLQMLITGVYGEDVAPSAKRSVYTYISNLRQQFGDLIVRDGDTYRLLVDESQIDSSRFESMYAEGASLVSGEPDVAARVLREVLGLWHGHPYAGIEGGRIVDGERRRLSQLRLSALQARIDADLALGRHLDLISELEALVAEHPFQEHFRSQQMLALYRSDRQGDALRAYKQLRDLLAEQLGVEPTPEIQLVEDRILRQDPSLDLRDTVRERRAVLVSELPDRLESAGASQREVVMARRDAIFAETLASPLETRVTLRGTAAYATFASVLNALEVARRLSQEDLRVAIDHGHVEFRNGDVYGAPVGRSARLVATANPGQILISERARSDLMQQEAAGLRVRPLGRYRIRGIDGESVIFQATPPDAEPAFPPLQLDRLPPPIPSWQPTIAGYELRDRLDENQHGVFYDAYQHSVGREVSILVFHPDFVSDPGFIRRFEAEAQRLTAIDHRHVLPVLDFWREPERAVIVYRAQGFGNLSDPRIRGPDTDMAMSIATGVGRGLASAHEAGVIHGGLAPSWIVFDAEGNPALSGLGLASMTDGVVPPSRNDYVPPESLTATPTPASDIFALGIITAQLLTGREITSQHDLRDVDGPVREVLRRAIDPDPSARYPSVRAFVEDFSRVVRVDGASLFAASDKLTEARNPFKGLSPFTEPDAGDFFGRHELIAELVECVASDNLILVVGPSGIGKSSVVKAGLIPAIRSGALGGPQDWLVTDMFPGSEPFRELAGALERVAVRAPTDEIERLRAGEISLAGACEHLLGGERCLIVVDQLEELFTHTADGKDRDIFLSMLSELAREPPIGVRVVATLRADFLDRPLDHAEFGSAIRKRIVTVQALSLEELSDAVRLPAEQVGISVDADLVAAITKDAADEPGALPLLQYTLADLFDSRTRDRLTVTDYRGSGGVVGAVGRRAEDVYLELSPDLRATARSIFLSLVTVDEESEDTRRRVRLQELEQLSQGRHHVYEVLEAFGQARLLTFDRSPVSRGPTVELAHEAILREWDRLASWIDAVRDDLLIRRRVATAAREWNGADQDASYLIEGTHLVQTEDWFERTGLVLTGIEQDFLDRSREAFDISERKRRKTRRLAITGLVGGLLGALALGLFAFIQGRVADARALENRVAELTSDALLEMEQDPQLAMLLALEAYEGSLRLAEIPPEVTTALQATVQQSRLERVIDDGSFAIALSPDGRTLVTQGQDDERLLLLYDLESGTQLGVERWLKYSIAGVAFHPDGTSLAVTYDRFGSPGGGSEPALSILDPYTLETRREIEGGGTVQFPSYNADGRFVAGYDPTNGLARVFDLHNPDVRREIQLESPSSPAFIDGTSILVYSSEDALRLLDVVSGREVDRIPLDEPGYAFVASSSDGELLAAVHQNTGRVAIASVGQARVIHSLGDFKSPYLATFSPDGASLVVASTDNTVTVVDLDSMARTGLSGHGVITDIEYSRDRIVVQSLDSGIKVWQADGDQSTDGASIHFGDGQIIRATIEPESGMASGIVLRDDGQSMAVMVDMSTNDVVRSVELAWEPDALPVLSDDGRLAAGLLPGATHAAVVDLTSGEPLLNLGPCEIPKGLSRDADLVAVTADCSPVGIRGDERQARTGLVAISDGTMIMSLVSTGGYDQVAIGQSGSGADDLALVGDKTSMTVWQISSGTVLGIWAPLDVFPKGVGRNSRLGDTIVSLDFSDNGSIGIVAYQTGHLAAFDTEAIKAGDTILQTNLFTERAHAGALLFAEAAGGSIVSGGSGISVWDPRTGELRFEILSDDASAATIIPDGSAVYFATGDGVMRRVPLEADELAELARSRVTRDLTDMECRRFTPEKCSVDS